MHDKIEKCRLTVKGVLKESMDSSLGEQKSKLMNRSIRCGHEISQGFD